MKYSDASPAALRSASSRIVSLFPLCVAALTVTSHATVTPGTAPRPVMWTNLADTTQTPLDRNGLPIAATTFAGFDLPVINQFDHQVVAFKAQMKLLGGVTPGDDEGVWTTGRFTTGPSLVLREGDLIPTGGGSRFGFANNLRVENLQSAHQSWTVCATNTDHVSGNGKVAVADDWNAPFMHNLAQSPTAAWSDLRAPVCDGFASFVHTPGVMAMWKRETLTPFRSGVERIMSVLPASGAPLAPPAWLTGFVPAYKNNQTPRAASPAISGNGWVAAYARPMPVAAKNEIRLFDDAGVFAGTVVQEGALAVPHTGFFPLSTVFGTIHNQLMAVSENPGAGTQLVAWQMANMSAPAAPLTSLWCRWGTQPSHCLAYQTQAAPDMPAGNSLASFYELQAVPDYASAGDYWVFWGAMISPSNRVAIYRTHVGSINTPPDLIATSVPFVTPVLPIVGGIQFITGLDRYFSVNVHGTLLFKATISGPAAQRHVLVGANVVGGHGRTVYAQSGVATAGVQFPAGTAGSLPADNFELARPEQGPDGRGQAIGTQWFTAKVRFGGSMQGIFWANGL